MTRWRFWVLAACVAAVAYGLRGSTIAFVDPTSTREMRRIELLLASGATPERDEWLGERSPPTFFPRLVAGAAQRLLVEPSGDPALRGVDEERLEHLAITATSGARALSVLALALLARLLLRGPRGELCAVGVAALFTLVDAARPTAVDPRPFAEALAFGGSAVALGAMRCADVLDRWMFGIVAGLLLGGALVTAPEAAAILAALACALLVLANGKDAQLGERAALVASTAFAIAGVLGFLEFAAFDDASELPRVRLAQGVLGVGVLFVFLRKFGLRGRPSWLYGNRVVPALIAVLPAVAWWWWASERWDLDAAFGDVRACARGAGVLAVVVFAARLGSSSSTYALALAACALPGALSCASEVAWVAGGALAVFALADLLSSSVSLSRVSKFASHALGVAFVALQAFASPRELPSSDDRVALIVALRSLRDATPSPGPWNHPTARPDWRVLCEPEFGAALAYHARRAPLAAAQIGEKESASVRAARLGLRVDPADIATTTRIEGCSYILVGEPLVRRADALRGDSDATKAARALASTTSAPPHGLALVLRLPDRPAETPRVVVFRVAEVGAGPWIGADR
ncbi:MAG: hypothetical protein K8S98_17520 [Planctomycetes bacterium]|nr:hypothetical protein [Planctomycetota bacterium]